MDCQFFPVVINADKYMCQPFSFVFSLVLGFIAKDEAREMLLQKPVGTFLLRFSDGILGGISVAYVLVNDQGN